MFKSPFFGWVFARQAFPNVWLSPSAWTSPSLPVLRRKAPKIRGEDQTSTNQEAAQLTADDPLAGYPQHLDDWLLFWTSFVPDVFGSCPQSIRGSGFGKLEISKQRQRVRRVRPVRKYWNSPWFPSSSKNRLFQGFQGLYRSERVGPDSWMKTAWPPFCKMEVAWLPFHKISKTHQLSLSQACSPGEAEAEVDCVGGKPQLWDQTKLCLESNFVTY